jgi:hypothetical protein
VNARLAALVRGPVALRLACGRGENQLFYRSILVVAPVSDEPSTARTPRTAVEQIKGTPAHLRVMNLPAQFDHESWYAAAGTFGSYALVLVAMFLVLFVVPFLVFLLL